MINKILSDTVKIFLWGSYYRTYKCLEKIWKEFHIQFLSTLDILQITRNFETECWHNDTKYEIRTYN